MFAFYKKYMSSLRPFPQRLMQAFANMNEEVSGKLTGPSDLTMLGPLKDFDLMPQLPLINIPVLLVGGDTDEVTVEEIRTYQLAIPNAQLAVIPMPDMSPPGSASHIPIGGQYLPEPDTIVLRIPGWTEQMVEQLI